MQAKVWGVGADKEGLYTLWHTLMVPSLEPWAEAWPESELEGPRGPDV